MAPVLIAEPVMLIDAIELIAEPVILVMLIADSLILIEAIEEPMDVAAAAKGIAVDAASTPPASVVDGCIMLALIALLM